MIRKLMKLVEEDFPSQGIESQLDLAADLPVLHISLDHLKQVLLNLIKNAREAMPTGGTLCVCTAKGQGGVTISVIDTGVGIPEQHLCSIFEPFFSTKTDSGGTGVGLAVCHSIVKNYGGSLEVDSQLGRGTTFHVFLPEYPPRWSARVFKSATTSTHARNTPYDRKDLDY